MVLVIAKLIFVASIEETVIVYVRSSEFDDDSHANCDMVDVVVAIVESAGGLDDGAQPYQVEYAPALYVPSPTK